MEEVGMEIINRLGQKYSRLTVISRAPKRGKSTSAQWLCQCDCGKLTVVDGYSLASGIVRSCGCLRVKHGLSRTPTYTAWYGMLQRCENPDDIGYPNYGGRGITVCERWHTLDNFVADMGRKPKGLTLERRDNSKGYFPENCLWANKKRQQNNKRTNRIVEWKGQALTVSEWADIVGLKYSTLLERLNRGWSVEQALTLPFGSSPFTQKSREKTLTFNGETRTLSEWAKLTGIPRGTLKGRLTVHKWTVERTLTTPLQRTFLTYKGKTKSLREWAEIVGIPRQLLSRRAGYGWSDEEILTTPIRVTKHKPRAR
jgi:hypothetical protein